MPESCASLCRGMVVSALFVLQACGGESKGSSAATGAVGGDVAGSGGATAGSGGIAAGGGSTSIGGSSGTNGGGVPAGGDTSMGGGGATAAGGMPSGGDTSIGGGGATAGSAGVAGYVAGASGIAGETFERAPITSECGTWPENCQVTCEVWMGGCVVADSGQIPPESFDLEVEVTAVQGNVTADPGDPSGRCLGGAFSTATEFTLVADGGTAFRLLLPAETIPPERFPVGTSLEVSYAYSSFAFFHDHALVVRQAGSLALFVLDSAGPGSTELADTELELSTGEPSCPWSIVESGACSEAHFHTVAQSGDEVVTDPCGSPVGSFIVSSVRSSAGERCGAPIGGCDGTGRSLASGVRTN